MVRIYNSYYLVYQRSQYTPIGLYLSCVILTGVTLSKKIQQTSLWYLQLIFL